MYFTRLLLSTLLALTMTVSSAGGEQAKAPNVLATVGAAKRVLQVWLDDRRGTWTLTAQAKRTKMTLVLPTLAIGTQRGTGAVLVADGKTYSDGIWVVEITMASPGFQKQPGTCSGTLSVRFTPTVQVAGAFTAGCLSGSNPRD